VCKQSGKVWYNVDMNKSSRLLWWRSVATMIGATVGVGIFGIPYAISQVGIGLALVYFLVLCSGLDSTQNNSEGLNGYTPL